MNERLHCHCGRAAEFRVREQPPIYTVDFFDPEPEGASVVWPVKMPSREALDVRPGEIIELKPHECVEYQRLHPSITPITHCPACGTDLYTVLRAGPQPETARHA